MSNNILRCKAIKATKPGGETQVFGYVAGRWWIFAWSHDFEGKPYDKLQWHGVNRESMTNMVHNHTSFSDWELEKMFKKPMNILLSKSFILERKLAS